MTTDSPKATVTVVTVIFVLLGILFSGVVALYWVTALEPRLKAEAVSQAEILARSQADFVGDSVRAEGDAETRRRRVTAALGVQAVLDEAEGLPGRGHTHGLERRPVAIKVLRPSPRASFIETSNPTTSSCTATPAARS